MTRPLLLHDDELLLYGFGGTHPLSVGRTRFAIELARYLGVVDQFQVRPSSEVDVELVRSAHDDDYIRAVRSNRSHPAYGIGTTDNPLVIGMHHIAARTVAATVDACRSVWHGEVSRAVNIAGGWHHAMPAEASGFCIYNDVVAGIKELQRLGCARIAYIDVDAHHGDGVELAFQDDPSVLTVSIHESPLTLFPGTGHGTDVGVGDGIGATVNLPVPEGTDNQGWLRAFEAVVPAVVRQFRPDIIISQHGADGHREDPLTGLALGVESMRRAYAMIADLADELCQGKWVVTGGGGYSPGNAVPRAWAHLLATVAGERIDYDLATPQAWRQLVGEGAPLRMGDGGSEDFACFEDGYDPANGIDRAIMTTRRAVFPELGLDPEY